MPIQPTSSPVSSVHNTPLQNLLELLSEDMEAVNKVIREQTRSPISLIPTLAGHLIASGGKRIRPLLTLASAKLVAYPGDLHVKLAACIEFIHTATLLHDDVVDESQVRRGSASANAVWGNKASVLVGDFLFSHAFELMVEIGSLPVLKVLSSASSRIAEGEILQLLIAQDFAGAAEHYFETIEAKTAKLFEAACESAGHLAKAPEEAVCALRDYGRHLGMAFQITDDVLDYQGDLSTLGKNPGVDFSEGKITLPVLLSWEAAEEEEMTFWKRTLEAYKQESDDFAVALSYLKRSGTLEQALEIAQQEADAAIKAISCFSPSPLRSSLEELALYTVKRSV